MWKKRVEHVFDTLDESLLLLMTTMLLEFLAVERELLSLWRDMIEETRIVEKAGMNMTLTTSM